MTGLEKRDRWAPSQRPYAFLPETFRVRGPGYSWHVVDAVWVGRKRGLTVVTLGVLDLYWNHHRYPAPESYDDALAVVDMRHGGDWHAQWDGSTLLVEPTHPLSPERHREVADLLQFALQGLPHVPDGYDGWYYKRKDA